MLIPSYFNIGMSMKVELIRNQNVLIISKNIWVMVFNGPYHQ